MRVVRQTPEVEVSSYSVLFEHRGPGELVEAVLTFRDPHVRVSVVVDGVEVLPQHSDLVHLSMLSPYTSSFSAYYDGWYVVSVEKVRFREYLKVSVYPIKPTLTSSYVVVET